MLLDYAKAFDHIDLNILLRNLDELVRQVESFLTKQKQRVTIGSTTSE